MKPISSFLKIHDTFLIVLLTLTVISNFVGMISRAFLQAKLSFLYISATSIATSVLKLGLAVVLVLAGYGIGGAMWAFFVSAFFTFFIFFVPLRTFFKGEIGEFAVPIRKVLAYAAPSSIALTALTFLITTDIIMVKHYFDPKLAGIYAGLSLVGRVIYFISAPIGIVMFPLIVQRYAKGETFANVFKLSIGLVFLSSVGISLFYFLFPDFTIKLFLPKSDYLVLTPYLGVFGLLICLYSLLAVLTNFFLSIKKTKVAIPIAGGALLQLVLLIFYHSTFTQIIIISFMSIGIPFVLLLLYYWKLYAESK